MRLPIASSDLGSTGTVKAATSSSRAVASSLRTAKPRSGAAVRTADPGTKLAEAGPSDTGTSAGAPTGDPIARIADGVTGSAITVTAGAGGTVAAADDVNAGACATAPDGSSASCAAAPGDTVTITAQPDTGAGYGYGMWSGDSCSGPDSTPCMIDATAAPTLDTEAANFTAPAPPTRSTVTGDSVPVNGGSVDASSLNGDAT
ncbi:MAG: hypothetical protein ABR946_05210, partial [Solirubrobacteraceae bacterium]